MSDDGNCSDSEDSGGSASSASSGRSDKSDAGGSDSDSNSNASAGSSSGKSSSEQRTTTIKKNMNPTMNQITGNQVRISRITNQTMMQKKWTAIFGPR